MKKTDKQLTAQEALLKSQALSKKESHEWTDEEIIQLISDYRSEKQKR